MHHFAFRSPRPSGGWTRTPSGSQLHGSNETEWFQEIPACAEEHLRGKKRVYSNNSFITTAKDHVLLTSSRCFCQIYILLCCAVRVRDFLLQNSLASTLIPQQIVLVSSQCLLCVTHLVKARTSQCSCY